MNALANMQINSEEHAYNTGIMNDSEDPATDQLSMYLYNNLIIIMLS